MKILITILLIITAFHSYSQTNQAVLSSYKTDCNGSPFINPTLRQSSVQRQMATQSIVAYDTVRALTEINDPLNADAYPWLSPDGLRMYFVRGGTVNNQLMFTERANTNSLFSLPVLVPVGFSTLTSCWLTNDELNVYICKADTLYYANRSSTSSTFNTPVAINLTGCAPYAFNLGVSLNAAQDRLFISLLYTSTFTMTTTELARTSPTSFSFVRTLTPLPGNVCNAGQLSKDDLNYFVSNSFNFGFSELLHASRSTPLDSFELGTLQQIQGINDPLVSDLQPSMSDSLNWVAFVRNSNGVWTGNDLYIAHKNLVTSVWNQQKDPFAVSLFPNPTNGQFTLSLPTNNVEITITDILGQEVLKTTATQKETTLQLDNNGVYFISLKSKDGILTRKLIVSR